VLIAKLAILVTVGTAQIAILGDFNDELCRSWKQMSHYLIAESKDESSKARRQVRLTQKARQLPRQLLSRFRYGLATGGFLVTPSTPEGAALDWLKVGPQSLVQDFVVHV
jgi:hypothetical protein